VEAKISAALLAAARELREALRPLRFGPPVAVVYRPLEYAWAAHELYLRRFGNRRKQVLFVGMNPGPFGMTQTGIPFGEVSAVRDWMGIETPIGAPAEQHPKRPVTGFDCPRSEVSGRRLWGLFAQRFPEPRDFFAHHFVANYCPLTFFEAGGRNVTPDKLPAREVAPLFAACDRHLARVTEVLEPEWVIGVGNFAAKRATLVCAGLPASLRLGQILHPSPASPHANANWAEKVTAQLEALGVW
jgi:single-strand selective monofunctional uracil DNA glycosylase